MVRFWPRWGHCWDTVEGKTVMRRVAIVVLGVLVLAACGSATEELTEQLIESETGAEVEFDGDSMVIESEDGEGSLTIEDDGDGVTISGSGDDGEDVTIEMGGAEVPEDFPMPIFDPSEVTIVSTFAVGDESSFSVTLEIDPGDAEEALAFYLDWFEAEGMEVMSSESMVIAESEQITSIVQVAEYGEYSEVILTWTPN